MVGYTDDVIRGLLRQREAEVRDLIRIRMLFGTAEAAGRPHRETIRRRQVALASRAWHTATQWITARHVA